MKLRLGLVVTGIALLAGCETTRFAAPPVAEQACDPALPGRWLTDGPRGHDADQETVELVIDAACRLEMLEHEPDGTRTGEATTIHVGSDGAQHYLWVDAQWAEKRMQTEPRPPAGDVYVLRYRIRGGRLELEQADTKAIAHRVIDGELKGEIARDDDELHVRFAAPVDPEKLRKPWFFDREKIFFHRVPAGG